MEEGRRAEEGMGECLVASSAGSVEGPAALLAGRLAEGCIRNASAEQPRPHARHELPLPMHIPCQPSLPGRKLRSVHRLCYSGDNHHHRISV